jgi:thiamine kinase-like enzyme
VNVPKELAGEAREFVRVGGKQNYLVDPTSKRAVRELKKQLGLYASLKKQVLTTAFPLARRFLPRERVKTRAPFIYRGRNLKFFDFERLTVTTLFESKKLCQENLKWLRNLERAANVPEVLKSDADKKVITTRYLNFELLQPRRFRAYVDELVELAGAIAGRARPKEVAFGNYVKSLNPAAKELVKRRMEAKGIKGGKIRLVNSHGDLHPGNVPLYGLKLYVLDYDSFGLGPALFDLSNFCFVPAHFNARYARDGEELFRMVMEHVKVTPAEMVLALSMVRPSDGKLQKFLESRNLFLGLTGE